MRTRKNARKGTVPFLAFLRPYPRRMARPTIRALVSGLNDRDALPQGVPGLGAPMPAIRSALAGRPAQVAYSRAEREARAIGSPVSPTGRKVKAVPAVADAIGMRLARLGRGVQVLAVTHAPQVAARANRHYVISKDGPTKGKDKRVATSVTEVAADRRREEIARMLAGAEITAEARAAAERLIKSATG